MSRLPWPKGWTRLLRELLGGLNSGTPLGSCVLCSTSFACCGTTLWSTLLCTRLVLTYVRDDCVRPLPFACSFLATLPHIYVTTLLNCYIFATSLYICHLPPLYLSTLLPFYLATLQVVDLIICVLTSCRPISSGSRDSARVLKPKCFPISPVGK